MGCVLSIHQNKCQKSLGCALYIGALYLPENTVLVSIVHKQVYIVVPYCNITVSIVDKISIHKLCLNVVS
jgi:hypothetical protein